jgi:hypothetical protein
MLVRRFMPDIYTAVDTVLGAVDDVVEFQMTRMSNCMPPLGFFSFGYSLDDWQKSVLRLIDDQRSVVVCAPTSSGKTVLSTYVVHRADKSMFVVPSEPLVWQVAAMLTSTLGGEIALATNQMVYSPRRENPRQWRCIVGTPVALESALTKARGRVGREALGQQDFTTFRGTFDEFSYAVYDEVHTLDDDEGAALQRLIRGTRCNFLALSATLGNAAELRDWFQSVHARHAEDAVNDAIDMIDGPPGDETAEAEMVARLVRMGFAVSPVKMDTLHGKWRTLRKMGGRRLLAAAPSVPPVALVEHNARFINLQRWYDTGRGLKRLHPMSAVSGAADLSTLAMTPRDTWDLWCALRDVGWDTGETIDPDDYLAGSRITLDRSRDYESVLKAAVVTLPPDRLARVLSAFALTTPPHPVIEIWRVAEFLRRKHFFPALFFQLDSCRCVDELTTLLVEMETAERAAHPTYAADLANRRLKWEEAFRKFQALRDRCARASTDRVDPDERRELEDLADPGPPPDDSAPHPDFVLVSPVQTMSRDVYTTLVARITKVDGLEMKHPYIRALKRGIGLYTNDPHLQEYPRVIQSLAQHGQLAIVFSDASLAYGVNMPFRTTVFLGDDVQLTPLMATQMSGRAGRRGLDREGNVVFLGMPLERIQELMLGTMPSVRGRETRYPCIALQRALQCYHHSVHKNPRDHIRYTSVAVTERRLAAMAAVPLGGGALPVPYEAHSWTLMRDRGYVDEHGKLAITPELVALVWELREYGPDLGDRLVAAIPRLLDRFGDTVRMLTSANERAKMESLEAELILQLLPVLNDRDNDRIIKVLIHRCTRQSLTGDITTRQWDDVKRDLYRLGSIIRLMHNCLASAPLVYGPLVTLCRKTFRRIQWTMRGFSSMDGTSQPGGADS